MTIARNERNYGTEAEQEEQFFHSEFLEVKLIYDLRGCHYYYRKQDNVHDVCMS